MSGPLVYIEYISRRPGVSLEAFHALAGHGQTGWGEENPEEVLLANLGRTWRTGPEPEYLAFWYTPGQGLDRFDDWERIFRSGEADEFEEPFKIAARIDRAGSYDPLIEPMRVFCGCDESQIVAARVLEHSIRKHASRPVRFYPMIDVPTPVPKDPKNRGRTGFSFSRFHIPRLAGYEGRGLYVDADMQVFGDLAELWEIPFDGAKVMCTRQDEPPEQWKDSSWFHPGRQLSVMLLDCARLDWDVEDIVRGLDEGKYTYEQLMFELCVVKPHEINDNIPPEWNHLEHHEPGKTKLLHYTVVPTQPWKNDKSPLRTLWEPEFKEARAAGVVHAEEALRLARRGHIKPSLALPPGKLVATAFTIAAAKMRRGVQAAEQRIGVFRHPRVLKLRARLGL